MKFSKNKISLMVISLLLACSSFSQDSSQDYIEDVFPKALSYTLFADVTSYGPYADKYCKELGKEANSHKTLKEISLSYIDTEVKRINSFKEKLVKLKEASEKKTTEEGANVQLLGIEYKLDTHKLMIDNIVGKTGMIENRKIISEGIEKAELSALKEFDNFNNDVTLCQDQLTESIALAKKGCERLEVVEKCDEEGNCTQEEVPNPVEGSCLAEQMIPNLQNIVLDYKDLYSQVLPSNLHEVGYQNLVTKYERFNGNNIKDGDWKKGVDSCQEIVADLYKKTAVVCETLRKDGKDEAHWNVPEAGNQISDLYESILERKPDAVGAKHWEGKIEELTKAGKSPEEAFAHVRGRIFVSKEKHFINLKKKIGEGVSLTKIEQSKFEGYEDRFQKKNPMTCNRLDCKSEETYKEDFESNEKLVAAAGDLIAVITETKAESDYFTALATEKSKWVDTIIGQSINRIDPLPTVLERIVKLNSKDLEYSKELMVQYRELMDIYQKLLELENSGSGKGSTLANRGAKKNDGRRSTAVRKTSVASRAEQSDTVEEQQVSSAVATSSEEESEGESRIGTGAKLTLSALKLQPTQMSSGVEELRDFESQALGNISKINSAVSSNRSSLRSRELGSTTKLRKNANRHLDSSLGASDRSKQLSITKKNFSSPFQSMSLGAAKQRFSSLSNSSKKRTSKKYTTKRYFKNSGTSGSSYSGNRGYSSRRSSGSGASGSSTIREDVVPAPNMDVGLINTDNSEIDALYATYLKNANGETDFHDGSDINVSNENLFNIVSKRYLRSGLKRLSTGNR